MIRSLQQWVLLRRALCPQVRLRLCRAFQPLLGLCEEVGVVQGVHLLSGEVRRVATALKVVEEVQEEVQDVKDEWEDEEVEVNGDQGRRRTAHFMHG